MASRGVILVVDDNQKNRSLCRQNLEMEDYTIFEAANGRQGLEVALSCHPDLILLDIMMPEMDGYQMLAAVRESPELQHVSVLMLTAKAGSEDVVRALDMGANDYLRKPFDIEEMIARANTLVNLHQAQEAVRNHQRQMETEMSQAAAIQAKMLPAPAEVQILAGAVGLAIAARTQACSQVNGDFFDLLPLDGHLVISICDCKGHGVWAGLMSMTVRALLRSTPSRVRTAKEALARLEEHLVNMVPEGEFVAMSQWRYRPDESLLTMCFAGMPPPLLIRHGDQEITALEVPGRPPLGLNRLLGHLPTEELSLVLRPGDKLIAFSDGLSEAMNQEGDLFGIPPQKICDLARKHCPASAAELAQCIWEEWVRFNHGQPDDDCTLLVLEKI